MNNLLDLVNTWAEKFTLRVLRVTGVSDEGISKVTKAFESRDMSFIENDNELKTKIPGLKFIFYLGLILLGFFIYYKLPRIRR